MPPSGPDPINPVRTVFKVQILTNDHGWVNVTRVGPTLENAVASFRGYEERYPADKYRLVEVDCSSIIERYRVLMNYD